LQWDKVESLLVFRVEVTLLQYGACCGTEMASNP
jgi:hypothetical protein